jgi:energy-coupling factor transporter transmembrane protein EcfT
MKFFEGVVNFSLLVCFLLLLFVPSGNFKLLVLFVSLFFVLTYLYLKELKFLIPSFALILLLSVLNTIRYDSLVFVFLTLISSFGLVGASVFSKSEEKEVELELPELPEEIIPTKKFLASTDSNIFHSESCRYSKNIDYSRKHVFNSVEEAAEHGLKPHSCV